MAPKRKKQNKTSKPTKRVKDGLSLLKTEWSSYPWTDDLLKRLTRSFPAWCIELIVLLFGYCNDPRDSSLLRPYIDASDRFNGIIKRKTRIAPNRPRIMELLGFEAEKELGRFCRIDAYHSLFKTWGYNIWPIEAFRYLYECPETELIGFGRDVHVPGQIVLSQGGHYVTLVGNATRPVGLYEYAFAFHDEYHVTNMFGVDCSRLFGYSFNETYRLIMMCLDTTYPIKTTYSPSIDWYSTQLLISEPLTSSAWNELISLGFQPQTILFCQIVHYLIKHVRMMCARSDCDNPVDVHTSNALKDKLCKSCYAAKGLGPPVVAKTVLHFYSYFDWHQ